MNHLWRQLAREQAARRREGSLFALCETFRLTRTNLTVLENVSPVALKGIKTIVRFTHAGIVQGHLSRH